MATTGCATGLTSVLPAALRTSATGGPGAAPAAQEAVVQALRLRVEAPDNLKALLEQHLDLARLQQLPAGERLSEPEWARLIAATPAQVRELLQTEGYFDPQVEVLRDPPPDMAAVPAAPALPDSAPAAQAGAAAQVAPLPSVRVRVTPGPRTRVAALQVQATGPLDSQARAGDAGARALQAALGTGLATQVGEPFRNPTWSASKQAVLTRLRAAGYATATLAQTQADIDTAGQRAHLSIGADSGPLFRAGPLSVSGLKHQDESTVRHLAGFDAGAALTEQRLVAYQDRLLKSGLFQSASVGFEPDAALAEAAPLRVRVTEQPLQQATIGLGVSANTGPRATLEHTHRRPLDWPLTAYNKLEWGRDAQSWTGDFQTHPGPRFYRNLLGVQIERVLSDSDVVLSQRLRLGRTQDTLRVERLVFVELLRSRQSALSGGSGVDGVHTASALTANAHLVWRDLDSVLLPTRGLSLALQAGAGQARSRNAADGPLLRLYGRLTGYWPLGSRWYGQARLELGQVLKRSAVDVPDALGFRAGGDDSVRGYAYRSLTPMGSAGTPVSGMALMTTSVELARPISEQLPQVWGAVFVDAGQAFDRWQDLRPAVGVGAGIRWRSPVGPLRADLAWGEALRKLRLHLSVGIAF